MRMFDNNNSNRNQWSFLVLSLVVLLWFGSFSHLHAKKKKKTEPISTLKPIEMTTGLMLRKIVEIPASADDVFKAWTTKEGVKTFFAPDAAVELAIHGRYEIYFAPDQPEGLRGGEGCKILSFVPGEFLSFTWNAPPSIPEVRKEFTWVVLHFQPLTAQKTRVSLIHLGWQAGPEWQKALKYFDKAWDVVLGRLRYRFQTGPLDWKKPYTPDISKKHQMGTR